MVEKGKRGKKEKKRGKKEGKREKAGQERLWISCG